MPYVAARLAIEAHRDARDHAGIGAHGVFPSRFVRLGRLRGPVYLTMRRVPREQVERTAIDDLEAHQMQMDRMRVAGDIDEAPGFRVCCLAFR
jgi:hypothetical protein